MKIDAKDSTVSELAQFLERYGLNLKDRMARWTYDSWSLMLLCNPAKLQAHVDQRMPEVNRKEIRKILASWEIPCTLHRLEIMTVAVVKHFKSSFFIEEADQAPKANIERLVTFMIGDVDAITKNWLDEDVPGYLTLNRHRIHLFTLLNLCANDDFQKFKLLYIAAFGLPLSRSVIPRSSYMDSNSIRKFANSIILSVAMDNDVMVNALSKQQDITSNDKDRDDDLCSVCLDKPISIRFDPCAHQACCSDCANMITACCICRANIQGHSAAVLMYPLLRGRDQKELFLSVCFVMESQEAGIKLHPKKQNKKGNSKQRARRHK